MGVSTLIVVSRGREGSKKGFFPVFVVLVTEALQIEHTHI